MRELPRTAPHEGLWVVYALRAAFAGTDSSSMPLVKLIPRVDVINTFRVFAGHFECFRVVSRSQIQRFRSSFLKERGRSRPRLVVFFACLRAS